MQVSGTMLAKSSEDVAREGRKTPIILHKLQERLNALPDHQQQRILRKELLLIVDDIIIRPPNILAADILTVNYKTAYVLLSTIISYLVVLIQFNSTC